MFHLSPSLADGLALGAAAGLSKVDVQLIIFLAIMLHKVKCNLEQCVRGCKFTVPHVYT